MVHDTKCHAVPGRRQSVLLVSAISRGVHTAGTAHRVEHADAPLGSWGYVAFECLSDIVLAQRVSGLLTVTWVVFCATFGVNHCTVSMPINTSVTPTSRPPLISFTGRFIQP